MLGTETIFQLPSIERQILEGVIIRMPSLTEAQQAVMAEYALLHVKLTAINCIAMRYEDIPPHLEESYRLCFDAAQLIERDTTLLGAPQMFTSMRDEAAFENES